MKLKRGRGRRRSIKAEAKMKEEAENDTSNSVQIDPTVVKPTIEDLITCQIWKETIGKDHRMCPQWSQIWCHDCIKPWFKGKQAQCPNCRKRIKIAQLKKSPLFEKLKEMITDHSVKEQEPKGWEVHNLPDDFYCQDWQILCCSRCALLSENHRNHTFTSLEDIYEIKKDAIKELRENLVEFDKLCQKLLEESKANISKSDDNLKFILDLFAKRVKTWESDYISRFNNQSEIQSKIKTSIEDLISEIKNQKIKVVDLLEHPHKNKLVKKYFDIVKDTNDILVKQSDVKVCEVIDGEKFENHFIPQYTTKECVLKGITKFTPEGTYIYSDEFEVVKDKFKLGAKVVSNKKSKSLNIVVRVANINNRPKQYEVSLYHKPSNDLVGEFVIGVEKDQPTGNHILHTITMNSK